MSSLPSKPRVLTAKIAAKAITAVRPSEKTKKTERNRTNSEKRRTEWAVAASRAKPARTYSEAVPWPRGARSRSSRKVGSAATRKNAAVTSQARRAGWSASGEVGGFGDRIPPTSGFTSSRQSRPPK